jgi:hypothetical protein
MKINELMNVVDKLYNIGYKEWFIKRYSLVNAYDSNLVFNEVLKGILIMKPKVLFSDIISFFYDIFNIKINYSNNSKGKVRFTASCHIHSNYYNDLLFLNNTIQDKYYDQALEGLLDISLKLFIVIHKSQSWVIQES